MNIFLETDRLLLRQFTLDDVENLVDLDSDPDVMRYVTGGSGWTREEVVREVLPRYLWYYEQYSGYGYWAAIEKSSGEFLGWFHFRPPGDNPEEVELGYRLKKSAWGRGYATEGSRALIDKGFTDLGAQRVTANAMAVNAASWRVMEKSGLKYVRTYHGGWPFSIPGDEHGDVEYALTREEWERARHEA